MQNMMMNNNNNNMNNMNMNMGNPGMGMNPMMMGGNGMGNMGMNPMMMGGNGMGNMGMNPMMGGMGGMGNMGMNPMMMGGNGMNMGMNPMMMGMGNMGMNPMMMGMGNMGMNQNMMTPQQKEEWKKQQRYLGYLYGKKMAEEKKKQSQGAQTSQTKSVESSQPVTDDTELTIKFNKGGNITEIKMKADSMIAELIAAYYEKTKNNGPFKYKGKPLKSDDCTSLLDNEMKNEDEITVG